MGQSSHTREPSNMRFILLDFFNSGTCALSSFISVDLALVLVDSNHLSFSIHLMELIKSMAF